MVARFVAGFCFGISTKLATCVRLRLSESPAGAWLLDIL